MFSAIATGISASTDVERSSDRRAAMARTTAPTINTARYATLSGSTQAAPAARKSSVHGVKSQAKLSISLPSVVGRAQLAMSL
jgi:hypothetical protein